MALVSQAALGQAVSIPLLIGCTHLWSMVLVGSLLVGRMRICSSYFSIACVLNLHFASQARQKRPIPTSLQSLATRSDLHVGSLARRLDQANKLVGVGGPIGVGSSSAAPTGVEEHPAEVASGGGGAAGGGGRSHGHTGLCGRRRASGGGRRWGRRSCGRRQAQAQVQAAAGAGVCSGGGRVRDGERGRRERQRCERRRAYAVREAERMRERGIRV